MKCPKDTLCPKCEFIGKGQIIEAKFTIVSSGATIFGLKCRNIACNHRWAITNARRPTNGTNK